MDGNRFLPLSEIGIAISARRAAHLLEKRLQIQTMTALEKMCKGCLNLSIICCVS
jgi:hypothetical protein